MSFTNILSISDPHLSERCPPSRLDSDWMETLSRKFDFLFSLASVKGAEASAICIAGDLFHQPKGPLISRRLDQWIYQKFSQAPCPVYAVPGNHDMQGHHLDSLKNHPYGCLEKSGFIQSVIWPDYALVGDDPLVIITGREFTPEGHEAWLCGLAQTEILIDLKIDLEKKHGKHIYVVFLSHCYWGKSPGTLYGEPVVPFDSIKRTGIDFCIIAHNHACLGINEVISSDRSSNHFNESKYVIGPGAFVRGTISETDTQREPKVSVISVSSDHFPQVSLEIVPHKPAIEIFRNRSEEESKAQEKESRDFQFIDQCNNLQLTSPTVDSVLNSLQNKQFASPRVFSLVTEYLTRAREGEVSGVKNL